MKKKELFVEEAVLHVPARLTEAEGSESEGSWTATVWRLDERNLNGRIYTTELAQRIVKENPSTPANDGHNADWQQEYDAARAVCFNPRIEHGELVVDIDFIDEAYEKKLEALYAKGVAIGVSSCGWGECDENGVVIPETYELLRFLDFVLCPAGQVYAKKNNEEADDHKASEPSVEEEDHESELSESDRQLAINLKNVFLRRK